MLTVKNGLFLKQSDVFLSGLLPLWMGINDKNSVFETQHSDNSVILLKAYKYRIVFLLDYKRNFGVFETLCKCIMGLFSYTKVNIRYSVIIHGFSRKSKVVIQDSSFGNLDILKEIFMEIMEFESNLEAKVDVDVFSTFEEGLQSLDLLPKDYLPVLVYITDGVSVARSSNLIGKSHLPMRLVYGKVSLSVIQVGSENGFTPNTPFGNVPDNELLRFLCILLSGRFLYAQDLPLITQSNAESDYANFYHTQLLYREADYSKVVSLNVDSERYVAIQGNTRQRLVDIPRSKVINIPEVRTSSISQDELDYPWKTNSLSPIISEILTNVREYSLPSSICTSRLITARIREGFILRSINVSKRNKIEVTLTKPWDLHVTILYTIKAYNGWSSFFPMEPSLAAAGTAKPLTVEVNVLAHHSFAILFINMYMIGQTTNPAIEDLYMRLMRLDEHLKEMYALDDAMPTICSIEYFFSNKSEAKAAGNMTAEHFNKELKDYFTFITKNIVAFRAVFDTLTKDWILYSKTSLIGKKRQVAAIYLTQYLSKWSCLTIDKQTYCKMIINDRKYEAQRSSKSYGFVIVKILMKTEYVATGRFYFYNVDIMDRSNIIHALQHDLDRTYFPGTVSNVMISCKRPMRKLMVYYSTAESSSELTISNPKIGEVLLQSRRIWWKKGDSDLFHDRIKQIVEALYKYRVSEGFNTVYESSRCISFYLEHEFSDLNGSLIKLCSIQYLILISETFIATEVWSEPLKRMGKTSSREYVHSEFTSRIFSVDQTIFTYFKTFSIIQRSMKDQLEISQDSMPFKKEIFANISNCTFEPGLHIQDGKSLVVPIECNIYPLIILANISVIDFGFSIFENKTGKNHEPDSSLNISPSQGGNHFIDLSFDSLISASGSRRNAYIFYLEFVILLKSFAFAIKSEDVSHEILFDCHGLSREEKFGENLHGMKFSDFVFFVKSLSNNCLAVIAVPSQHTFLCRSDSETNINTPVIIYECHANPLISKSDNSANLLIRKIGSENHIFISKGEDSNESFDTQNLISDLEGLFYESWFRTACVSLSLCRNIDFDLDSKILNRCIRKVQKFSISDIINLFCDAEISLSNVCISDILYDWNFVDCTLENIKKTLWTLFSREKILDIDAQTIGYYFVELELEGNVDGSSVFLPLLHDLPEIPQSFKNSSFIVVTVVHFEPKDNTGFDASSVVDRIKKCFSSFALEKLFGSSVDCSRIKTLVDDLIRIESPEFISGCVSVDEVSAFIIGEEENKNEILLDVMRENISDQFLINIMPDFVFVRVLHDNRYWLFIEFSNGIYLIKCFSKLVMIEEKEEIINSLKNLITKAVFKANQRTFLKELNENRLASDYLINPGMIGMVSGTLSSDLRYTFDNGTFECPLIFEYNFQLHHRVTAELALNAINGVMQPFAILNRPGMFVSLQTDDQGKLLIYYMHFICNISDLKKEHGSISLRMYGIKKLQAGVMELVNMIHSKLDVLAVNMLGTWISRYGAAKLLKDDFDILFPVDKAPSSKHMIHKCETDPSAFLHLVRKKFVGSFCPMAETPKEILDRYFSKRFERNLENSGIYYYHALVYNSSSSREPTEFEKQVGLGVCSIILVLLDGDSNPIEGIEEPALPIRNQSLRISVEMWPHETLNLDILSKEIVSIFRQTQFDLKLSLKLGMLYWRCASNDLSIDFSAFAPIDNLLTASQNHNEIQNYEYHLNIESYIATMTDILFEEVEKLCGGLVLLKKYHKVDRGNEIQTLIVGFMMSNRQSESFSPFSTNDLELHSLSNVQDSSSKTPPYTFQDLVSLKCFIISLQKKSHVSTYRIPSDLGLILRRIVYRWATNFDLKNQNISPIKFQGTSANVDPSHLAAIDIFEEFLLSQKDRKLDVFEREIQLQQWTTFPLINEQLGNADKDIGSKKDEWNIRYQKEILNTFGAMLKDHGYRHTQNMPTDYFRVDSSKVSSFERYFYQMDSFGVLNVVHSSIHENNFFISHFRISREKGSRKEDLLRRLVVGLYEKHIKLTTELIHTKESGYPCLLEKLKILHQTFPKAPAGSRTFLVKGFYDPTEPNVSFSLFQYIFLNPQRYGFSPLLDNIGCYIRTKIPDFRNKELAKTLEGEEYDYILVLYYNRQQAPDAKPIFKYYILILNLTPLSINEDLSASEYIGSGYYLGDIVRNAEKRIIDLLSMSLKYYSRDSLWRQLHESQEVVCQESSEWITLFLEKISLNSRSFYAVDPTLEKLFSNPLINWNKAMDHLCQVFKCHLLIQDSATHFILYNELNSDYLVHLSLSNHACEAFIVSREGVSDPIEWEAIDHVVNELLLFLVLDTE